VRGGAVMRVPTAIQVMAWCSHRPFANAGIGVSRPRPTRGSRCRS
jgi:hypothetical protein